MNQDILLVLGARSDIGIAVAHRFAKAGYDIQLAARKADSLSIEKSDIELRYQVSVSLHEFDALEIESHHNFVQNLPHLPTVAVCAVGYMGEQRESELDVTAAMLVMKSNYEGPACIMSALANRFEQRGFGTLVGISSVAGERGRASNYIYGSAKAGFTAFLSGLRNRLSKKGVHVVTVLPGFVVTKMTEGMNLHTFLTSTPKKMAQVIFNGVQKKQNIIYFKAIWGPVMLIIRNIPEILFKKGKL